MNAVDIIEFEPRYTEPVKALLVSVLQFLDLHSATPDTQDDVHRSYNDADLDHISEIYTHRSRFWVALTNGTVIGMVAIEEKNANEAVLRRMFVAPKCHGMGVGAMLLDTALAFAQIQGYSIVTLDTHNGMKRAHSFYEKHGFRLTGEDTQQRHYSRACVALNHFS